jgi:hypothetical protein
VKNIVVITREQPSKDSVVELVRSLSGHWQPEPLDQGVVEQGQAHLFVYYRDDVSGEASEYEEHEIQFLRQQLGVEPHVAVEMAISHSRGSDELAIQVAERIVRKWGGYIDDCVTPLGN